MGRTQQRSALTLICLNKFFLRLSVRTLLHSQDFVGGGKNALTSAFSMPELVRDVRMRNWVEGAHQILKSASVIESGYGKYDEGGALSAYARTCVEAVHQR